MMDREDVMSGTKQGLSPKISDATIPVVVPVSLKVPSGEHPAVKEFHATMGSLKATVIPEAIQRRERVLQRINRTVRGGSQPDPEEIEPDSGDGTVPDVPHAGMDEPEDV